LLHRSYKPLTTVTNTQIDELLLKARGHWITFWHESDNDGLSASARADRIALMNRLYDRNVALGRPVTVVPTFTGWMFSDQTTDAYRKDFWRGVKGDLVGVDYDGIHNSGTDYDDETVEVMQWLAEYPEYTGWAAERVQQWCDRSQGLDAGTGWIFQCRQSCTGRYCVV
jgi:hypothetical protein